MKKNSVFFLGLFLIVFNIYLFPQGNKTLILKFDKKNITLGSSLSNFQKLFSNSKQIDSNRSLITYQLNPDEYGFKLFFNTDNLDDPKLIGLNVSCFSDNCYFGESSYDVISKQLKIDDRFLHQVNDGEGTKTKFYHYPGYLVIDEQYVGLESGDPAFSISLINLRYLDKWPDNLDYSALYTLSIMIMTFQKEFADYQLISDYVESIVKNKLEENSKEIQSEYHPYSTNPYTILMNIYEKKGDYVELLKIYKKLELMYPSDYDIKSNVHKYESIINSPNQNIDSFWLRFKTCIKSNDYSEIQKMTFFPFLNHMTYLNAGDFNNFRLPDYILPLLDKVKPKESKMSFSSGSDKDGNIVKVNFPIGSLHEVNFDGATIYFSKVNGEYKFVAILNGE